MRIKSACFLARPEVLCAKTRSWERTSWCLYNRGRGKKAQDKGVCEFRIKEEGGGWGAITTTGMAEGIVIPPF